MRNLFVVSLFAVTTLCHTAYAEDAKKSLPRSEPENVDKDSLSYAINNGKMSLDARYRYEFNDQDGLANKANASTLRTRAGYVTGLYKGFRVGAELEHIATIGRSMYNDGYNGKSTYPQVSDPEDRGINQLYIAYEGIDKTKVTVGRQMIFLDNERWIGQSNWRQNNQSYDAVSIASSYFDKIKLFYAYVSKVNRTPGPQAPNGAYDSDSHLLNASYEFTPALKVTAYNYLLAFDDNFSASRKTVGLRFTGKYPITEKVNFSYALEGANQRDYAKNTSNINENYTLVEPALSAYGFTAKLGYEVLGGNGTNSVQTTLATLHSPNGWADKFTSTPAGGLEDRYVSLTYKVPEGHELIKGTEATVKYHEFESNATGAKYGTEWDATISQTFNDHYTVGLKYADYQADTLFTDTQKVMAWVQVKF